MRFMMLMIPGVYRGNKELGPEFAPTVEQVEAMMKYNEELAKSGALLSGDGLHPLTTGARVSYAGGKATVIDGPFAEVKEVLGGYWIIQANSKEEAVEWARKVPAEADDIVEVRQIFETEDWPEDIQKAADNPVVREAMEKGRA